MSVTFSMEMVAVMPHLSLLRHYCIACTAIVVQQWQLRYRWYMQNPPILNSERFLYYIHSLLALLLDGHLPFNYANDKGQHERHQQVI
jgi:hypothetical protein